MGCLTAPIIVIFYVPLRKIDYVRGVVIAADKMMAAQLGFSGRFTVSTECAHDDRFRWMYSWLNEISHKHCELVAWEEGVYCSLRDRKIRNK